jgi:anthranilate synthase/aminodeoxychorismate synthase-like glutamine amidotransferase
MILLVDNYDSFTYNVVHSLERLGESVEVIRNDHDFNKIDFSRYKAVILSPGPSNPDNAGITLEVIKKNPGLPLLGICLGMQAIVQSFGGKIVRAPEIVHGKQDTISHTGEGLFYGVPQKFRAVRYHSLCAGKESFPVDLDIEAFSSDGVIQGIRHKNKKIYGIQFHPESYMTEYGDDIFRNFLKQQ